MPAAEREVEVTIDATPGRLPTAVADAFIA
jgi:hypothetical protein